jgi:hypothetical protein
MATKITRDIIESYLNCKYKCHLKLTGESGTQSDYEAMMSTARSSSRVQALGQARRPLRRRRCSRSLRRFIMIPKLRGTFTRKFSNRIAGPLYRCRRVMRDMAAGKIVPAFKARENDLMKEVFDVFNAPNLPDHVHRPCLSASAISVPVAPAQNRIPAPPVPKAKNTVPRPLEAVVR